MLTVPGAVTSTKSTSENPRSSRLRGFMKRLPSFHQTAQQFQNRPAFSVHLHPPPTPVAPPAINMPPLHLLTTKISVPPLRLNVVKRPRLTERLNAAMKGQHALVVAPAGWGKTTLLSAWHAEASFSPWPLAVF